MGQDQERGAGAAGTAPGPRDELPDFPALVAALEWACDEDNWPGNAVDFGRQIDKARTELLDALAAVGATLERVTGELAECRRVARPTEER